MDWNMIKTLLEVEELSRGHAVGSAVSKINELVLKEIETAITQPEEAETSTETDELEKEPEDE